MNSPTEYLFCRLFLISIKKLKKYICKLKATWYNVADVRQLGIMNLNNKYLSML